MAHSLDPEFLSGRTPPKMDPESLQYINWWDEQINRCLFGFKKNGRKVTGSYYHYLNFYGMEILEGKGENKIRRYFHPHPCNTDEAVFQAMEDCHRSWQTFMMFTSGGTGKSSMVASYVDREFTFFPRSQSIITASTDVPATQLMKFVDDSLMNKPKAFQHEIYPYKKYQLMGSQTRRKDGTVDPELSYNSTIEKIVFGDNSGAVRSKRPTLLVMEEIGNWVGGASLLDCYNACVARGKIAGESSCFYMMIGTGGHTRNNVIKDVQEMIDHPDAYNLYLCDPWNWGKKNIFFIPAYKKRWGYFEETGIMDEVGAKAAYDAEREKKKDSYKALLTLKREFPYTLEECFLKEVTGGLFYPNKLEEQFRMIQNRKENSIPEPRRGWWKENKITGIPDFIEKADGPVWMYEEPHREIPKGARRNTTAAILGQVPDRLYVGGYDGIDQTKKDSQTDGGSKGALWIKKRTTGISTTNNTYVIKINWRPEGDIDEINEQVLLSAIAYNCKINIEYTKISVKKYFESKGYRHLLMARPKAVAGNSFDDQMLKPDLIGTVPTPQNINYGIQLLQSYVFNYYQNIYDEEFLKQLAEFTIEDKGKYDLIMAALWCEVGDEDMPIYINREYVEQYVDVGYYDDPITGELKYGIIPPQEQITASDFVRQSVNPFGNDPGYEPDPVTEHPFLIDAHLYYQAS
jgi:hypothetical protein